MIPLRMILACCLFSGQAAWLGAEVPLVEAEEIECLIYPEVNESRPNLSSPFRNTDGREFITAVTKDGKYAVVPVTLRNDGSICRQLDVDEEDFPSLSASGLHSETELDKITSITGRSVEEITKLALPGGLSHSGFMAEDETVLSVIRGDNLLVRSLGLTHPQMARPLFHLLNLMEADMKLERWNTGRHRWENIRCIFYNGKRVYVDAWDTKGGQLSIFDDGIVGSLHIRIWRNLDADEQRFLRHRYPQLKGSRFDEMIDTLCMINTGEMQPQYIMRYGFYEGHTYWRADPVALAIIFGLRELPEIDAALGGNLHSIMNSHFNE